jgi:16S rRNA (cytidine1402-2'-O)-methyltransferase
MDPHGKLVVVGTPIGNMDDLSPRAEQALATADVVCAEDTRVTGRLLAKIGVATRLERCDENVISKRTPALVERMKAGETIAFCSDAGMPGVSDPGAVLVDACRDAGVHVEVVPGPTAVATAVGASGFPTTAFYFGGFLPRKRQARARLLASLAELDALLVFYESPHRAAASLASIAEVFPKRRVCLARELTKLHEEVVRGPAPDIARQIEGRGELKGEVVIVVDGPSEDERRGGTVLGDPAIEARADELFVQGGSTSKVAKEIAGEFGLPRNAVYEWLVGRSRGEMDGHGEG